MPDEVANQAEPATACTAEYDHDAMNRQHVRQRAIEIVFDALLFDVSISQKLRDASLIAAFVMSGEVPPASGPAGA